MVVAKLAMIYVVVLPHSSVFAAGTWRVTCSGECRNWIGKNTMYVQCLENRHRVVILELHVASNILHRFSLAYSTKAHKAEPGRSKDSCASFSCPGADS